MKLLAPSASRWQQLFQPRNWFTVSVIGVLLGIEFLGRSGTTDFHDTLALAVLGFLALIVSIRHRRQPLFWVNGLVAGCRKIGRFLRSCTFGIGIDLRGKPSVRQAYPLPILVPLLLMLSGCGLLLATGLPSPLGLRWLGVNFCYLAYLGILLTLWTSMVAVLVIVTFFPLAIFHDYFVTHHPGPGPRSRRPELIAIASYFLILTVIGSLFPLWVHLAVCGLALLANLVTTFLPASKDVQFLWKPGDGRAIRSIPWGQWVVLELLLISLPAITLVLLACGPKIWGGAIVGANTMPLTMIMGMFIGWLAPGMLVLLVTQTILARFRDPARRVAPRLRIVGEPGPDVWRASGLLKHAGWQVSFGPKQSKSPEVAIRLVAPEQSDAREYDPPWPLAVSLADLNDPDLLDRLLRRDEILQRRALLTGLERMFKRLAGRKFRHGHGFWVAPQFWFVQGISRDEPEEDDSEGVLLSGTVGMPYYLALSRSSRHHIYKVLRALQVDMIFVEDGVGYRRLRLVMRKLFEIYDKHAGERRAEDQHFTGLNKTRVIIHDFTLEEPFKSETYPEPKYEHLGRARILHIFRDRGEQDEPLESPFDFSFTPAPASAS